MREAEEYAALVGAEHYSTSAKLNQGLNELFLDISQSKRIFFILKTVQSMGMKHQTLLKKDRKSLENHNF